jgi:CopG family nickel-responsive transcriptional regulator
MQRVTITIDDDLLVALDELATERTYASRSEAVRDILREALAARVDAPPAQTCVAALSYVYDHHVRTSPGGLPASSTIITP